jgi:hypothetical protein
MASLPSQHPSLGLHLCDAALTPIITSSRTRDQLESLTALASTSLTSHAAALRFGLGDPRRIFVEHQDVPSDAAAAAADSTSSSVKLAGPITIHTYLGPSASATLEATSSPTSNISPTSGVPPPLLLGLVVAEDAGQAAKAHKAGAKLERAGREFQQEWARGGWDVDGDEGEAQTGWRYGFGGGGGMVDSGMSSSAIFGTTAGMGLGVGVGPGMSQARHTLDEGTQPGAPRRPSARRRQYGEDSDDSDAS